MASRSQSDELDHIVRTSLSEFAAWTKAHKWFGREKDAVNLYVLGFLQKQCRPLSILFDPTQTGIEVAVPQVIGRGKKPKMHVNKDLVIWDRPGKTCWDRVPEVGEKLEPRNWPLCILEWKLAKSYRQAEWDCRWLQTFGECAPAPYCCGYSVVFGACRGEKRIRCARVTRKGVERDWMVVD